MAKFILADFSVTLASVQSHNIRATEVVYMRDEAIENRGLVDWRRKPSRADFVPVRIVHWGVPGRLRVHVASLHNSRRMASSLILQLSRQLNIIQVTPSILTGNTLVTFDPDVRVEDVITTIKTVVIRLISGKRDNYPTESGSSSFRTRRPWHALESQQVLEILRSSKACGLNVGEARRRTREVGKNRLQPVASLAIWPIAANQLTSLPVLILLASASLSVLVGGVADAVLIVAVTVINGVIGFNTEYNSHRIIHSLGHDDTGSVRCRRGSGEFVEIPSRELVPGDIVALNSGPVFADCRILSARNLQIDESNLTGESAPVVKGIKPLPLSMPLPDRCNMVYSGSIITSGSGIGGVVAIGSETKFGQITLLARQAQKEITPLQRELIKLSEKSVKIAGGVCAFLVVLGLVRGHPLLALIKSAVSLAVAAIPEGLPVIGTSILSLSIAKLRRNRVYIKNLHGIEGLGAIQSICFDKTGTLTTNRLAATTMRLNGRYEALSGNAPLPSISDVQDERYLLLLVAALCNDAIYRDPMNRSLALSRAHDFDGSAVETALLQVCERTGMQPDVMREEHPRIDIQYRGENRNYMTTIHHYESKDRLFVAMKGAPDEVLGKCISFRRDHEINAMTPEKRAQILRVNAKLAASGLRVLAFACQFLGPEVIGDPSEMEERMIWLGMIGFKDPVKPGMAAVIRQFHEAGIDVFMLTGDQFKTAQAIARELNISCREAPTPENGQRLDHMSPDEMRDLVRSERVFSRVSPATKLKVVRALQADGKFIAMVGDGVNDAPALKAASVGIAIGKAGNGAVSGAADVVLAEGDLALLLNAIYQGRLVRSNIRNAIHFLLSTNLSEMMLIISSLIFFAKLPLNTMQLLWINLLTDIFPSLAMIYDKAPLNFLKERPVSPDAPLFERQDEQRLLQESAVLTAISLFGLASARRGWPVESAKADTFAFSVLTLSQLVHAYNVNPASRPWRGINHINKRLFAATFFGIFLLGAGLYVPILRRVLGTTAIGIRDFGMVSLFSSGSFLVNRLANIALSKRSVTNNKEKNYG